MHNFMEAYSVARIEMKDCAICCRWDFSLRPAVRAQIEANKAAYAQQSVNFTTRLSIAAVSSKRFTKACRQRAEA
jgi:hypothetical protein